jgi:hypothetical protein
MEIGSVRGTAPKERERRFFVDFGEQWSSLLGRCNWYDFTLIEVGGEWAPYTGRFEFQCWLLGAGFRLTYVYDHSFNDQMTSVADRIKAELEGRTGAKVEDPFGLLDEISKRDDKESPS